MDFAKEYNSISLGAALKTVNHSLHFKKNKTPKKKKRKKLERDKQGELASVICGEYLCQTI